MNFIAIIILTALVADFILHAIADILNLRMLNTELPEEFSDVYDADRYRKSQEYLRVNTRLGWITSLFSMAVVLGFWFGKGFPWLDQGVSAWGKGPVA